MVALEDKPLREEWQRRSDRRGSWIVLGQRDFKRVENGTLRRGIGCDLRRHFDHRLLKCRDMVVERLHGRLLDEITCCRRKRRDGRECPNKRDLLVEKLLLVRSGLTTLPTCHDRSERSQSQSQEPKRNRERLPATL